MVKIRLRELRKWQWHCGQQRKCCECKKASECFDVFGANKPTQYEYTEGVIRKCRG